MRGKPITPEEIRQIIQLRKTGHSMPEIMKATRRGSSTVFKYMRNVKVLPEYTTTLRIKQGGSRERMNIAWDQAHSRAHEMLRSALSKEQMLCILAALYWGEGNKTELNMINSDPALIKVFMECLYNIGVKREMFTVSLRLHDDIDKQKAIKFWSKYLSINQKSITSIEIVKSGMKKGKLEFGMCRLRVAKSATYFKLLMSLISEIKRQFNTLPL